MRLSPAATAFLLLGLALILPGCGEERTAAADRAGAAEDSTQAASAEVAGTLAERQCRNQLRPYLGSLDALREKLAVGLNYEDYLREVRRLKAVYDEIPVKRLAIGCLTAAGAPGERALNRYLDAANAWGDCLAQVSCGSEEVEPKLQHRWARNAGQRCERNLGGSSDRTRLR